MQKLTPDQSRAMQQLRGHAVVDYLQSCLDDVKMKLLKQENAVAIRVLQGQGQVYQHLLDSILNDTHSGKR
jgi:arginine repressor